MAGQGGSLTPIFGSYGRVQTVTPPLKGSFPLDYSKECHLEMLKYMCCLKETANSNSQCRGKARDYFQCRMDKGLMDHEEWNRLGYSDIVGQNEAAASSNNAKTEAEQVSQKRPRGRREPAKEMREITGVWQA